MTSQYGTIWQFYNKIFLPTCKGRRLYDQPIMFFFSLHPVMCVDEIDEIFHSAEKNSIATEEGR